MRTPLLLLLLLLLPAFSLAASYPKCWLREGECLDDNKGPLMEGVKPQWNPNILKVVSDVDDVDACVSLCAKNESCSHFTYYAEKIESTKRNESNCELVGFNLGQACFNLEKTCVMHKHCTKSGEMTCKSCKTGMRPIYDPEEEPAIVLIGGQFDELDEAQRLVYQEQPLNTTQLMVNSSHSCQMNTAGAPHGVQGGMAGYVNGDVGVVFCGGYSLTTDAVGYQKKCYSLKDSSSDWVDRGELGTARAFAQGVSVPKLDGTQGESVFYVIGGYNKENGFLSDVEYFDGSGFKPAGSKMPSMNIPVSHACHVVTSKNQDGKRYLYHIGGWNLDYLREIYRVELNDAGESVGSEWELLAEDVAMLDRGRADHACAQVQIGKNSQGIVVTGGNHNDTAWSTTVEFFNMTGDRIRLESIELFPRILTGRHNHGLITMDMKPVLFGGWANGALKSPEVLADCGTAFLSEMAWEEADLKMHNEMERFAVARVPKKDFSGCA